MHLPTQLPGHPASLKREVIPAQSPPNYRGVSKQLWSYEVYDVQKVRLMMMLLASNALSISQLVLGKKAVGSPLKLDINVAIHFI